MMLKQANKKSGIYLFFFLVNCNQNANVLKHHWVKNKEVASIVLPVTKAKGQLTLLLYMFLVYFSQFY